MESLVACARSTREPGGNWWTKETADCRLFAVVHDAQQACSSAAANAASQLTLARHTWRWIWCCGDAVMRGFFGAGLG